MSNKNELYLKIIFLGEPTVGKTTIINKYSNKDFENNYTTTIGLDFLSKTIQKKDFILKVTVLDTAGQERFRSILPSYIKGADGIFLVFDLTQKSTFQSLPEWVELIKDNKEKYSLIILGNKKDLNEIREVSNDDIEEFKTKNEFKILEISAKNIDDINNAFDSMYELFISSIINEDIIQKSGYKANNNNNLIKKQRINNAKKVCC